MTPNLWTATALSLAMAVLLYLVHHHHIRKAYTQARANDHWEETLRRAGIALW